MAAPQSTTEGALFRALRSVDVDPTLAFDASEETRRQAGQNVIEILGARIDALGSRIDALGSRVDALGVRIDAQTTVQKALGSLITTQQRVSWALVGLLATLVFGLLYNLFSS